eukprot:s368_g6.t1
MIEKQFGLRARFRWAGRLADGAEEGVAELQAAELEFPERRRKLFGQIDQWHMSETAASHADQLSSRQGFAWKDQYLQYLDIIRRLRAKYGFGVQKSLPEAKYRARSVAIPAPHKQATRTMKHEAVIAAHIFLVNLRNMTFCEMVSLQAAINSARQMSQNPGPLLWNLDPRFTNLQRRGKILSRPGDAHLHYAQKRAPSCKLGIICHCCPKNDNNLFGSLANAVVLPPAAATLPSWCSRTMWSVADLAIDFVLL